MIPALVTPTLPPVAETCFTEEEEPQQRQFWWREFLGME